MNKNYLKREKLNLPHELRSEEILACFSTENSCIWEPRDKLTCILPFPFKTLSIGHGQARIIDENGKVEVHTTNRPLEFFQQMYMEIKSELADLPGGAIGFLSYDASRFFENIKGLVSSDLEPDLYVLFSRALIEIHRNTGELFFSGTEDEFELIKDKLADRPSLEGASQVSELKERFTEAEFCELVKKAKDYIVEGDIFQVVLANSFSKEISQPRPLAAYSKLKTINPSPFHFYFSGPQGVLFGASPETYLKSSDGKNFAMRLVAGTYPRAESGSDLVLDEKEKAEHMMLVDHARNDIGRGAKIGTVKPTELFSVESYKDLHHLVSQVDGQLKENKTLFDAFRNCFPIATLTGTPKIRAMEIISELEGPSRGSFGGAAFKFGYDNSLESTVIIRSVLVRENRATVNAGCGIVYDSVPEREYKECKWKAQAVLEAL